MKFLYLQIAITTWAILLIYSDGIKHILHDNVLEYKIGSFHGCRRSPCFDPHTISSLAERRVPHYDSTHIPFSLVPSKASNTNSMARTTVNLRDVYLCTSGQHCYAVVSGLDHRPRDSDPVGGSNLYTICVWTVTRSWYPYVTHIQVVACKDTDMCIFAVEWS